MTLHRCLLHGLVENWPIWLLSVILIVAAVIDGWLLKVPNWLTIPLVFAGWAAGAWCCGFSGLAWSMAGTLVGLGLLLPAYAIGGMGAGDVKLMAGIGAWIGATATFYAFCVTCRRRRGDRRGDGALPPPLAPPPPAILQDR